MMIIERLWGAAPENALGVARSGKVNDHARCSARIDRLRQPLWWTAHNKAFADEHGFVLLPVVLICAVIGATILALSLTARDGYREIKLGRDLVRARLLADNAIVRIIAAIGTPADPLRGEIMNYGAPLIIKFNDTDVLISVENESHKVDLNSADALLLSNALSQFFQGESLSQDIYARILAERKQGAPIEDVMMVLTPAQRFSAIAERFEKNFTVATGARGISVRQNSLEILRAIPGISAQELQLLEGGNAYDPSRDLSLRSYRAYISPERPIFTVRAKVQGTLLPPLQRKALFAVRGNELRRQSDLMIISWRDAF